MTDDELECAALAALSKDNIGPEEIEKAWLDEAERRRDELRSGRVEAVSWQEVRREMFSMVEQARAAEAEQR